MIIQELQIYTYIMMSPWLEPLLSTKNVGRRVQNGSRAHPAFYPMGTGGSFPGGKAAEE